MNPERDNTPLVLKFGGTSLATGSRMRRAAARVGYWARRRPVLAVVSAPGDTTDRMTQLFDQAIAPDWRPDRETDRALATGELFSAALLAAALRARDCPARSVCARDCGLLTAGTYGNATVRRVDSRFLQQLTGRGIVPVIAGFQGIDSVGDVRTLGRGGSDLTAVAVAEAVGGECHLITDVEGVYTDDPAIYPDVQLLHTVTHSELCSLAETTGVVHAAAAHLAREQSIPVRVYRFSAPNLARGTEVVPEVPASLARVAS